jgi:4-hydroxymandelate oxidase
LPPKALEKRQALISKEYHHDILFLRQRWDNWLLELWENKVTFIIMSKLENPQTNDVGRLPISIEEMEVIAREKLSTMVFDYYAGGAHDEITLRENSRAFERICLAYRVLVDVSKRDLSTTVLGEKISLPILVAPTALQKMAHVDGEMATAKAAAKKGTIMTVSTLSNCSVEEVAEASGDGARLWFQLYVYKDRLATKELVQRAEKAGYKALVLTVDSPMLGWRLRDVRNKFQMPEGLTIKNLFPYGMEKFPKKLVSSGLMDYLNAFYDQSLTWKDIEWLRSITKLPVIIKGIVRADDACLAWQHGASAVIVSNHGGRQLDTSPATIEVLPEVVAAVGDKLEVLVDGGIRCGGDVLKAIALGAKAVLVGRPILWGLAYDGQAGVEAVLDLLAKDFDLTMTLCGCRNVGEITPDLIWRRK